MIGTEAIESGRGWKVGERGVEEIFEPARERRDARSDRSLKKGKGALSIWAVHGLIPSSDARIVGLYS